MSKRHDLFIVNLGLNRISQQSYFRREIAEAKIRIESNDVANSKITTLCVFRSLT